MLSLRASGMVLCAVVGSVAGTAMAQGGVPQEWTIELQCRSSLDAAIPAFNLPQFSSLSSQYVSIDDDGGVAIRVFLSGNPSEGIFYGKDGVGGLVVTGFNADPIWGTTVEARAGLIAAEQGSFDDGAWLYDTKGNLVQAFNAGGSEGVSGFSGVTLTSDGAICYRGDFGFTSDKIVIDEYIPMRTQTLVAQTGGEYSFLLSPEINDARQVAFNSIPTSGPSRRIVRVESDLSSTTIAETGAMWSSFVNSVGIAQSGDVAFSARRSADSIWEVLVSDGTTTTTIASGDDETIDNSSLVNFPPVANSDRWVAFRATDTTFDSTALWVGDGDNLVKLIEYDQMIETDLGMLPLGFDFGGLTGKQVTNGVVDINDNGQVAFAAFLRNGTIGVFVATPVMGCAPDLTGEGDLNFLDVSAFLAAYGNQDPIADFEADGNFNFLDVSAFLKAFGAGCP